MPEEEIKVKKRRVTAKDFGRIENFIMDEFRKREGSRTRKDHEEIWRDVDKQIAMVPPNTAPRSRNPEEDWHSAIQLGAIADALEILSADVMRFAFPVDRNWFTPHVELTASFDQNGEVLIDRQTQRIADGVLRSLMSQQHADFGFKQRIKQATKESLAHGGFVGVVKWDRMTKYGPGGRTQSIGAPVLDVHSMWNSFPDPSPSVYGTELFYRGTMILRSYMPREKFMRTSGFMRKDQVPKIEAKPGKDTVNDVELITWYGDISLDRKDGDFFLPNMKIILANGKLVFMKPNEMPYPQIIYSGYERDSLLDPYYTSPLIKRAPTHKLMTELLNRYVDASELKGEPPSVYDAYDSTLVAEGGPALYPGAKIAIKGGAANFKSIDVGDPSFMFQSVLALRQDMREGLGVDSVRSGVSEGTEQTATEITKREQKGELRSIDFLRVMDAQVLKPFLHMQHDFNRKNLENYPFFNNEINTPDFMRASKDELPKNVIFEVTGSKEVLGEQQRAQKFVVAVQGAAQIPQISQRTDWDEVTLEMWNFTGSKDPERFIIEAQEEVSPEQMQEIMQAAQQLQQQLGEAQQKSVKDDIEKASLRDTANRLQNEIAILEEKEQAIRALSAEQKRIDDRINQLKLLEAQADADEKKMINGEKSRLERDKFDLQKRQVDIAEAKDKRDEERAERGMGEAKDIMTKMPDFTKKTEEITKLAPTIEKMLQDKQSFSEDIIKQVTTKISQEAEQERKRDEQMKKEEEAKRQEEIQALISVLASRRQVVTDRDGKIVAVESPDKPPKTGNAQFDKLLDELTDSTTIIRNKDGKPTGIE